MSYSSPLFSSALVIVHFPSCVLSFIDCLEPPHYPMTRIACLTYFMYLIDTICIVPRIQPWGSHEAVCKYFLKNNCKLKGGMWSIEPLSLRHLYIASTYVLIWLDQYCRKQHKGKALKSHQPRAGPMYVFCSHSFFHNAIFNHYDSRIYSLKSLKHVVLSQ